MNNIRDFVGKRPVIDGDAWVDESAVVIGDVTIGANSSIWPLTVVRGDIHAITIGSRSNIQDGCVLHVTHGSRFNLGGFPLVIGDDVTVGHKAILHGCEVGGRCLIGMGAVVMDGAVIEPQVIVAAGALVPGGKRLEGRSLWRGSPVRRVRALTDEELEYLDYVAAHYVKLAQEYRS
ncbi:MAG: gamma carbonic anhydrase family protein [Sedimenticola sp.]